MSRAFFTFVEIANKMAKQKELPIKPKGKRTSIKTEFKPGNEWWRNRINIGRPKTFTTAIELYKAIMSYFESAEKKTIPIKDFIKSGDSAGQVITLNTSTPFTIKALCIHLGINHQTWLNYKDRPDFFDVVTHAEDIIYVQKFEGAAIMQFSPNIIARDLGLVDKKQITETKEQPLFEEPK
jgi:DNA-packaging protein gp3